MAYHDENGKITIDEAAAAKDIKRLNEAAQVLKESRDAIRSLQRQCGDMQGQMSQAILEKAQEMDRRLTAMIEKLQETAAFIQQTVRHYELLDEQIKQAIQAAASAAAAAASTAGINASNSGAAAKTSSSGSSSGGSGRHDNGSTAAASKQDAEKVLENIGNAVNDLLGSLFKK